MMKKIFCSSQQKNGLSTTLTDIYQSTLSLCLYKLRIVAKIQILTTGSWKHLEYQQEAYMRAYYLTFIR